jgi:hypothetical protein
MSVINCNYIKDEISCLWEPVSTRDIEGFNVKYLQISRQLSDYQIITHS